MSELRKHLNKEDLKSVFSIYSRQAWLIEKEKSILELFNISETSDEKQLLLALLSEFKYLNDKVLNSYLEAIADFIIVESGFSEEKTQIAAITYDDEADSSQKILDYIKIPLFKKGWSNIKTVNRFGATVKRYKDGLDQIVFVDEFIGSGQTILGRIKQLQNDLAGDFELKFCFIAGMENGISKIEKLGYEVFCPLVMKKGITDYFAKDEVEAMKGCMLQLESKLAQQINEFKLEDYSFGYNKAEALYTLEGCSGNTPNSVFPIFWWPRAVDTNSRETLLTRFERGLK